MFFENLILFLITVFIIISSLSVVFSTNPVYSILNLVLVFIFTVLLLFFYNIYFIGLIFLVVYVGAIAVLFLFVIMMLNISEIVYSEYFNNVFPLTFFSMVLFIWEILMYFFKDFFFDININGWNIQNNFDLNNWYSLVFVKNLDLDVYNISFVIYNYYNLHLFICCFIMLLSMIGSISLTLNFIVIVKRQNLYNQLSKDIFSSIYLK